MPTNSVRGRAFAAESPVVDGPRRNVDEFAEPVKIQQRFVGLLHSMLPFQCVTSPAETVACTALSDRRGSANAVSQSEIELTEASQQYTLAPMGREMTGEVEIVPGIVGPELITYYEPNFAFLTPKGLVKFSMAIRFDREWWRYVCTELHAREITTELLRDVKIADWVGMALLQPGFEDPAIRQLPNPDGREPWGFVAPEGASKRPNERALAWVSHLYRYGLAVSYPTKTVEEGLKLPRSTASRWIAMAREAGYLGPSEGPGKAGG
jgi:hypothetical protein